MIDIVTTDQLEIRFKGRLDATNADAAMQTVQEATRAPDKDILLDLGELEYISSAGLQVILQCAKNAQQAGRQIALTNPNPSVREILKLSGFLSVIRER